jgi:hypothetical protein
MGYRRSHGSLWMVTCGEHCDWRCVGANAEDGR